MRHHNKNRKFGRTSGTRAALMRSLLVALITEEKIKTTETKAKALRPIVEKMVTRAKTDTLHSRRIILSRLSNNDTLMTKLFSEIAPRYMERDGGYTRITKVASRSALADASSMAVIEFVK